MPAQSRPFRLDPTPFMQGLSLKTQGQLSGASAIGRGIGSLGAGIGGGLLAKRKLEQDQAQFDANLRLRDEQFKKNLGLAEQRLSLDRAKMGIDNKLKALNALGSQRALVQDQLQSLYADPTSDPNDPRIASLNQQLDRLNKSFSAGVDDIRATANRGKQVAVAGST